MTKEIWVFYKETNHNRWGHRIYEVSNLGRVKLNDKLFKCRIGTDGYYYLCGRPLHRIVAELFIPNPYNLPCIDHIDGNRLNNMVSNLRWVTYKTNNTSPIAIQRHRESAPKKLVLQYTKDNKFVKEYVSAREASGQTNIYYNNIIKCCKHRRKSAGGYIWKYKED